MEGGFVISEEELKICASADEKCSKGQRREERDKQSNIRHDLQHARECAFTYNCVHGKPARFWIQKRAANSAHNTSTGTGVFRHWSGCE